MSNRNKENRRRADIVIIAAKDFGVKDIIPTLKPFHIYTDLPVKKAIQILTENDCEEARNVIANGHSYKKIIVRPWDDEVDSNPKAGPEGKYRWSPGMKEEQTSGA